MFVEKMQGKDVNFLSPLVWAYVGDGVHSLYMRESFAVSLNASSGALHALVSKACSAKGQSAQLMAVSPSFTEQEADIARRARNAKTLHIPKNSDLDTYKKATELEAVLGFLYLCGENERLHELLRGCKEVCG